ncbi:Uncharacterised protein [Shigella flexneri]|nr:Uncharacterised protein [Shigella flexneri]
MPVRRRLRNPHRVQRVNANRRRNHHRQHCRIQTGAAVLTNGCTERGGETGDGFRNAQTTRLCFHIQWDRRSTGTAGKGKRQHRPYLTEVLQRTHAINAQQNAMHSKHNQQTEVGRDNETSQFDDVLQVRTCNHFGH